MKRNTQRIPAILTQAWVAAACFGLAGASYGHGFEMGEVAIATGYRQDSSSISICSGLADNDFFGFGKLRSRDVHLWEIGIGASANITDHVYVRSAVSYGVILGGKVTDSGVADINSNPLNSVLGEFYAGCCQGNCGCDDNLACSCNCQDKIGRATVPVTASLGGNAVDFNLAFGYGFRPTDDFMIAPVVGYNYNSQRQRWHQSIYGPIQMIGAAFPCPIEGNTWTLNETTGLYDYYSVTVDGTEIEKLAPGLTSGPNSLAEDGIGCITFGNCFDGTVYRARWSGPFIGLDFGWAVNENWNLNLGYAISYNHFTGKFQTFVGDDNCYCDQCPALLTAYGDTQTVDEYTLQNNAFVPSEMRFGSWGLGQEVSFATDFRCGNWVAGIGINYMYRNATHCADSDPCVSCETTRNPNTDLTSSRRENPVWSYAQMTKARWGSFSALVSLGYLW